jgi:hypothetical protein
VDYYRALADEKGFLPEPLSRDPLHPSAEGYRLMAGAFRSTWDRVAAEHKTIISKGGMSQ